MVVTSPYGPRTINGVQQFHRGVDLRNYNKPIYTVEDCTVIRMGTGAIGEGYIVTRSKRYVYKYIHVKCALALEVGDTLLEGEAIGLTNFSGTDSLHLHFEVWDLNEKKPFDPCDFFTVNKLRWRHK